MILRGIFAFHEIKNSQPLLEYLAKEIGEGCTPKAVSHRLTSLRKSGKMVNSGSPNSTPIKKAATSRASRASASKRGGMKGSKGKKTSDADTTSEDEEPVASQSMGRKRGRTFCAPRSYAESDATTGDEEGEFTLMPKKVKVEPVEQEGVTSTANNNAPLEENDEGVAFI
ncbi:hypothetical protein E8E12_008249 [Didymella heteroderae]|uniref:Uncharacterized protein n=1 Tax=Didymella heteroderae TaxID=1769908 RepID=A0A9P5C224_9PLEO|nr:hypothetical protein E8E12_008249 [Didymella heteroderae]